MSVPTYTKSGGKASIAAKLDKTVFEVNVPNHELLKQAYLSYLANGRENLAKTKTRGEVRGSTIKPWKQKGTGRARFGSRYNPIWRGGGITFGPTGNENYSHKLPTNTKRVALRQALTTSYEAGKIIVVEEVNFKGKTVEAVKYFDKIGATKNILLVVDTKSTENTRAVSNLKDTKIVSARYLNVYDILNADSIVVTSKALSSIQEWLGGKA
jgi:large subunit ribosomal protein L4